MNIILHYSNLLLRRIEEDYNLRSGDVLAWLVKQDVKKIKTDLHQKIQIEPKLFSMVFYAMASGLRPSAQQEISDEVWEEFFEYPHS